MDLLNINSSCRHHGHGEAITNERDKVSDFIKLMFCRERQVHGHKQMDRIIWILLSTKKGNRWTGVIRITECLVLQVVRKGFLEEVMLRLWPEQKEG